MCELSKRSPGEPLPCPPSQKYNSEARELAHWPAGQTTISPELNFGKSTVSKEASSLAGGPYYYQL